MSINTTIQIKKNLKEEFEDKFELVYGVRPQTGNLVEKTIKQKIEELDQEIKKKK